MKKIVPICAAVAAAAMMLSISTSAMAMGGPSGPHVTYPVQGNIGEVIVNPYPEFFSGGDADFLHPYTDALKLSDLFEKNEAV